MFNIFRDFWLDYVSIMFYIDAGVDLDGRPFPPPPSPLRDSIPRPPKGPFFGIF